MFSARRDPVAAGADHARHPDDGAVDRLGAAGRRRRAGAASARRRRRATPSRVGAGELDVLARADLAAQVADRAAQEARADVEPEHERRLGDRLEERRAVARAVGVGCRPRAPAPRRAATAARATPSASRSRRGARSRRARSARASRIASSTVRSLRCAQQRRRRRRRVGAAHRSSLGGLSGRAARRSADRTHGPRPVLGRSVHALAAGRRLPRVDPDREPRRRRRAASATQNT